MSSSRDRLLKQFRELVGERLKKISANLMELEAGPAPESGRNALRELHGLKGEARMMGFPDVNNLVHEMEELVRIAEPVGFHLTGGSADALLSAADAVGLLSGATDAGGTPPEVAKLVDWLKQRAQAEAQVHSAKTQAVAAPKPASETVATDGSNGHAVPVKKAETQGPGFEPLAPAKGARADVRVDSTVRVSQEILEDLTSAVTNLNQLARRREMASQQRLGLSRELAALARSAEDLGPQGAALAARLNRTKDMAAGFYREDKLLANEELRDLRHVTEQVQTMRMLPLSLMFEPFPRMVRDLSRELGKEVDLVIEGGETQADRTVVEALKDPLLHLVRNSLDHGIERADARTALGKSTKGKLALSAVRDGGRIVIRVQDDGAGLSPEQLRKAAVRKGLMDDSSASALTDSQARELIFVPGFSSKDITTDISGRGVGLDVVRVRVQGLGGDVTVSSTVNQGCVFELRVPVSLTVAPLLFVEVQDQRICLAASYVSQALKVEPEQIKVIAGRPALKVHDEVLPFVSLESVLGLAPERAANEGELVLLVRGQASVAAVSVDRVLEERVQAVLPLKGMLSRYSHLAGATPVADGSLAMVISASHLVATAQGVATLQIARAPMAEQRRRRILVVDDSPLTRELISSLLEAMGYDIYNANDGAEAYEKVCKVEVDMVVTDLEMPRMDGLELTRKLKGHATLRRLPVVIVTTRGGDADRRRGMEAGADGYIAKGDLVRQDLVDVVSRLLN
jgi:two-component system chemotaxis sensor kinase CheA